MPNKDSKNHQDQSQDEGKVGSSREAARSVGGSGDFGFPEVQAEKQANPHTRDDEYAGRPKGSTMGQTGAGSAREHGVGAQGGRGHGSGGETDPDIIGFGTPGGGSVTGAVNEPPGPDDADKSPSAPHGRNPVPKVNVGGNRQVQGSTNDLNPGDLSTTGDGGGAANVANADREIDDSFAGEVSNDEARGTTDNSPSDNQI